MYLKAPNHNHNAFSDQKSSMIREFLSSFAARTWAVAGIPGVLIALVGCYPALRSLLLQRGFS